MLRDGLIQGNVTDDRPPRSEPFYPALHERAAALMDKYVTCVTDDGEWIEWGGGECPVPDVLVDARLRDGNVMRELASDLCWTLFDGGDGSGHIVAYRVVRP